MRKIDLEKKSLEIQSLISRYTKESFVCFFADFIRHHPERSNIGFSEKLKSKYKDSLYLIMLRLSSNEPGFESLTYSVESDRVLQKTAEILLEIVSLYLSSMCMVSCVQVRCYSLLSNIVKSREEPSS